MKLLIDHARIITMDDGKVYDDGAIAICDGRIAYVGEGKEWAEDFDRIISANGGIVMPGLINAHSHSPMTMLRGYGSDVSLQSWLSDYIFPMEEKLDNDAVYYGTLLACAEMIKSGTTAFADMYFMNKNTIRAALSAGMNINVSHCVTGTGQDYKDRLKEARSLYADYNGAGRGLVKVEHSAHSVYACSREAICAVAKAAEKDGTGIHIHLSETMKENRDCYRQYGKSPTEVMADCGVFRARTNAAHCVYLSENDMDILEKNGVSISHNPSSNLKLASGVANIKEALEKNINVALGTDGAASNNSLDMFSEMKLAALLHKGMRLDPTLISAQTALSMATVNGARALGRETETGKLAKGYRADLIILDPDAPALLTGSDPVTSVVYSGVGGCVKSTMVAGKFLMENGKLLTIDMEEVKQGVNAARERMGI